MPPPRLEPWSFHSHPMDARAFGSLATVPEGARAVHVGDSVPMDVAGAAGAGWEAVLVQPAERMRALDGAQRAALDATPRPAGPRARRRRRASPARRARAPTRRAPPVPRLTTAAYAPARPALAGQPERPSPPRVLRRGRTQRGHDRLGGERALLHGGRGHADAARASRHRLSAARVVLLLREVAAIRRDLPRSAGLSTGIATGCCARPRARARLPCRPSSRAAGRLRGAKLAAAVLIRARRTNFSSRASKCSMVSSSLSAYKRDGSQNFSEHSRLLKSSPEPDARVGVGRVAAPAQAAAEVVGTGRAAHGAAPRAAMDEVDTKTSAAAARSSGIARAVVLEDVDLPDKLWGPHCCSSTAAWT